MSDETNKNSSTDSDNKPEEIVLTKADRIDDNSDNKADEIVLTKADRIDDNSNNKDNETFHEIFITPIPNVDSSFPFIMGHLIQQVAINEMKREKTHKQHVQISNEHTKKMKNNQKPSRNNIHSMKAGNMNTINTTNDEIKRSIVKYYTLLICLIILISISSMIFIRLMREKQHYEVLTSKNNI